MDSGGYSLVTQEESSFCFELVVFEEKTTFSWLYLSLETTVKGFNFLLALVHCVVLSKLFNLTLTCL